jgi:hypothetical protein
VTPRLLEQGLERSADGVEADVLAGGSEELDADGQPVLVGQPRGDRDAGDAGEVRRDRGDVGEAMTSTEAKARSKSRCTSVRTFCALP